VSEDFKQWNEEVGGEKRYDRQTDILKRALATSNHSLDTLLHLMRSTGEAAVYLCGTRLDNAFGFGSNDLGLAISAQPQDGDKAAEPGYHPGSTEVYTIFQGSLVMELLDDGNLHAVNCGQFDVLVIPPGQCHRVRFEPEREAASFIVKTNPHHKPGVIRCNDCTYFSNPTDCSVHRSWNREKADRLGH